MKWYALFIIVIFTNNCFAGISNEPTFTVDVSEIRPCSDRGLDTLQFYLEKTEADHSAPQFSGNVTIPIDFDDNVKFYLNFAKYEDGAYEDKFFEMTINGCNEFMEISDNLLIRAFETDGNNYECPIIKSNYTIEDFVLDFKPDPEKVITGYYQVFIDVIDSDGNKQGCLTATTAITEN